MWGWLGLVQSPRPDLNPTHSISGPRFRFAFLKPNSALNCILLHFTENITCAVKNPFQCEGGRWWWECWLRSRHFSIVRSRPCDVMTGFSNTWKLWPLWVRGRMWGLVKIFTADPRVTAGSYSLLLRLRTENPAHNVGLWHIEPGEALRDISSSWSIFVFPILNILTRCLICAEARRIWG